MADYTFDGKRLRDRAGHKLGELDRNLIRAVNAAQLGEIQGKNIRNAQGKKVLELDGKNVKDDRGRKVSTLKDIRSIIDGEGEIELVALWQFFVRK